MIEDLKRLKIGQIITNADLKKYNTYQMTPQS